VGDFVASKKIAYQSHITSTTTASHVSSNIAQIELIAFENTLFNLQVPYFSVSV
jgi:hypothetical protein